MVISRTGFWRKPRASHSATCSGSDPDQPETRPASTTVFTVSAGAGEALSNSARSARRRTTIPLAAAAGDDGEGAPHALAAKRLEAGLEQRRLGAALEPGLEGRHRLVGAIERVEDGSLFVIEIF